MDQTTHLEKESKKRILQTAQKLFADQGFDATTTRQLAEVSGVSEGAMFHYFPTKKAILVELATKGWIDILTDLLTELSEMASYQAVAKVMKKRIWRMRENADIMKICFREVPFHPDLRDQIQTEVIDKMTEVTEVFFSTAMDKGIYRQINPKIVARVFLAMFAIAGFSEDTLLNHGDNSPQALQEMAEGLADIFLNGVLLKKD